MTLVSGTTCVKATARSSTARPQEIAKSPFRKMKKLEFLELRAAWLPCRESRADAAAVPQVPRRRYARAAVLR
jgi:hypothetical protein